MLYRGYYIHREVRIHDDTWVAPFGNSGIIACWQLPQTYRSLLRPSSPVVPRYPPVCSYVLTKTHFFREQCFGNCSPCFRMDPLSCLAHESSSLCSFQRSKDSEVRAFKAEQCSPAMGASQSEANRIWETSVRRPRNRS